jgi:hypothetical protein
VTLFRQLRVTLFRQLLVSQKLSVTFETLFIDNYRAG